MMKNTNDFSRCEPGEKLWARDIGVVTVVEQEGSSLVKVINEAENPFWYNKIQDPDHQSLFFGKPQVIAPEEPPRLPNFPVDTLLMVSDIKSLPNWNLRYFKGWDKNGKPRCYAGGQTSYTSEGVTSSWNFWKLPAVPQKELENTEKLKKALTSISCVAYWLENQCSPLHAIKELNQVKKILEELKNGK